jgi:hypothetical protein
MGSTIQDLMCPPSRISSSCSRSPFSPHTSTLLHKGPSCPTTVTTMSFTPHPLSLQIRWHCCAQVHTSGTERWWTHGATVRLSVVIPSAAPGCGGTSALRVRLPCVHNAGAWGRSLCSDCSVVCFALCLCPPPVPLPPLYSFLFPSLI